jgi:type IV pilus assembly protein PilV
MHVRFAKPAGGFSLVEVMVALVIVSIGLLGLAKMESLALSSTSVAGSRAIAAIEASSLAAAMHANPGYWAAGFAPATTTVYYDSSSQMLQITELPAATGLAIVKTGGCLTAGTNSCSVGQMAAFDVQKWAFEVSNVLPSPLTTITCGTNGFPVTCTVQIQWTENAVAADAQQQNLIAAISSSVASAPTYTLFVQP